MAVTYSNTVANARLDVVETTIGTAPTFRVRTGPPPATADTAASGTVLATATLPSDWMANAASRAKGKSGTWEDLSADASGRPGHFEIVGSGGTMRGIAAAPWKPSTVYATGDVVTNDSGKLYRATAGGTSASSGGPTGTGGSITDSGVTWTYAAAAPDMALDGDFTAGQGFSVTSFNIAAGN